MPYTIKSVTRWANATLPAAEQIAKVRDLARHDFTTNFDVAPVTALRQAATQSGDMLTRGALTSTDGLERITTSVWKTKTAYNRFANNPVMVAYLAAMAAAGWSVTITPVVASK